MIVSCPKPSRYLSTLSRSPRLGCPAPLRSCGDRTGHCREGGSGLRVLFCWGRVRAVQGPRLVLYLEGCEQRPQSGLCPSRHFPGTLRVLRFEEGEQLAHMVPYALAPLRGGELEPFL